MEDCTFLRLQDNKNVIRALTPPFSYLSHYTNGKKSNCISFFGSCPICNSSQPKKRWLIGVLNRADGKQYVLDIGQSFFTKLRDLAKNPDIGNPETYDIEVTIDKQDVSNMYNVKPLEKSPTPVTDEDRLKLKEQMRKLTDPVACELDKITNIEEFKQHYIAMKHNPVWVDYLAKTVEAYYPQYMETLKLLLTFS